jgi:stage V sporulation protein R
VSWSIESLADWDARIRDKALEFGLDPFPQEFEICDHHEMLSAMAYHGMPSHYPHWSYGKSFEKLKTLYDYGVSGLPYEMVINANPSLAYLMRDNSLLLQILTIAHVYGHNDFFRHNFTFSHTRPEYVLAKFRGHAGRVRAYSEDPSIGPNGVERVLDAAHALSLQCRRNLSIKKLPYEEERRRLALAARPREHPYDALHKRAEPEEPDPHKVPPSPEEDLLLFIRDHNRFLEAWERDLLTIVVEQTQYFIPQIETKIMNEGWASFWHREILNSLDLPQDLYLEFLVRHNQVLRPIPGGLNPYHLGLKVWDDLLSRADQPTPEEREVYGQAGGEDFAKLFEVRAADRDVSFLRRFLTQPLMQALDLFEYQTRGDEQVVAEVSDEEGWRQVKKTLLRGVGMGGVPVIKVEDADHGRSGALYLRHYHDGRDLHQGYGERTLAHLYELWGRKVVLETVLGGKKAVFSFDDNGFSSRAF